MVRIFKSAAQRKAAMARISKGQVRIGRAAIKKKTVSQEILAGVRASQAVKTVDDLFPVERRVNSNLFLDESMVIGYVKDIRKPMDGHMDDLITKSMSVVSSEPVPESVHKDERVILLTNADGSQVFMNRKYLSYVKSLLGDDIYVQFGGSCTPVFFVDRKTRHALIIGPMWSESLENYGWSKR